MSVLPADAAFKPIRVTQHAANRAHERGCSFGSDEITYEVRDAMLFDRAICGERVRGKRFWRPQPGRALLWTRDDQAMFRSRRTRREVVVLTVLVPGTERFESWGLLGRPAA